MRNYLLQPGDTRRYQEIPEDTWRCIRCLHNEPQPAKGRRWLGAWQCARMPAFGNCSLSLRLAAWLLYISYKEVGSAASYSNTCYLWAAAAAADCSAATETFKTLVFSSSGFHFRLINDAVHAGDSAWMPKSTCPPPHQPTSTILRNSSAWFLARST